MKKLWLGFTKHFGTSIIHPQFIVKKIEYSAIEYAKKYSRGKLLDIGCGNMPYKNDLLTVVNEYIGLDYPTTNKMYAGAPKPDVFGDAKSLPFTDKSFDSVLMLQVLEHVDEPQVALKEAARVLKSKGSLIISIPFLYPIHDAPHDYTRFTEFALRKMLEKDFKIVKFSVDGNFLDFWMQSLTLYLFSHAKTLIDTKGTFATLWAIILLILGLPLGVITNIISLLLQSIKLFNTPNLFPLNYTIVARKK